MTGNEARRAVKVWGGLLALSVVTTVLLELAHLPAALLLGPMAAAVLLAVRGAGLALPGAVMTMAQGIVGLMIAGILPPGLIPEIAARWQVVGAGTLSTLAIAALLGWMLTRSGLLPGTTAIWGSAPGAASVMTLLSQDYGADIRLVAFMQYLRVACVALAAALVARAFGAHGHTATPVDWFAPMPAAGVALTVALAALFSFGGQALKLPGGPFLAPMLGGIALIWSGTVTLMLPPWLLALAYCGIGWAIGLRFTPAILAHAGRVFPRVLGTVLALIAACGGVAVVLVIVADVDPLTAYLATSPGGADAVAILSASTHVDVPFVMSMQMARFLLVVLTGPAVARALSGRQARRG